MAHVTSSKTASVRRMLKFRPPAVRCWNLLPRAVSRLVLRTFRGGEGAVSFGLRYLALNRLSAECGEKVVVFPQVVVRHVGRLTLGTNVSLHEFCYIDAQGGVRIGSDVAIAHGCSILSADHQVDYVDGPVKDAPSVLAEVVIEDDVWLGAGCRILKGVRVGRGAVVGAGAVVTRDVPPMSIVAGVPARVVRRRRRHTGSDAAAAPAEASAENE
jgi:acetyltransferase-like isoleucine patch superfamily enzyme